MAKLTHSTRFRFWLWLIRLIGVIVPRRLRADWRHEWEAELSHREALLTDWDKLDRRNRLDLLLRSTSAFWDALWMQTYRWEDEVIQDLRFGLRMLRKNPGFALTSVLTLALGIGANTALFGIVKSVLLDPLPFAQPERLLQARLYSQQTGDQDDWVSPRDVLDWRERSQSFESIGRYSFNVLALAEGGMPEAIYGAQLSPELLPLLGVQPEIGRFFVPEEERAQVIILSDDLWRRRFGARPEIIGQTIRASGLDYTVVGVMPPGFNFPLRLATDLRVPSRQMGFWMTIREDQRQISRANTSCNAILRLKPGADIAQAQAELDAISAQLAHEYPQTNTGRGVRLVSLKDQTVGSASTALLVLFGAVGLVVLIVCANAASLLLVRADGRRKEMAVRQSLGASRLRLARQVLSESLLLAFAGGAAGTVLAVSSLRLLISFSPQNVPRLAAARIDVGTLGFAFVMTLLIGALLGAVPAWRAAIANLNEALKDAARAVRTRRRSLFAAGNLLVTCEIALALALSLSAGLLLNSFVRLLRVDPGFRAEGLWAAIIILPRAQYPDAPSNITFFSRVIEQLEGMPGVETAGTSNSLPMTGHGNGAYLKIEGRPSVTESDPATLSALHLVSANYLRTIDVPLRRGRLLDRHDTAKAPAVAVINEAAAQRFWPGEDPIGKRFSAGSGQLHEVVGIVGDTHLKQLDVATAPEVYLPVEQAPVPINFLAVRATLPRASVTDALRRAVAAVNPEQPVYLTLSMEEVIADSVAQQRFIAWLFGGFSALALLLAAIGVYGIVAHTVAQRTREIGIRIALGARSRAVLRMVMAQGIKSAVIGSIIGLIVTLALHRILTGLLYGVTATDPATFLGVAALLFIVAMLACWIPARRATKVDPLVALRCE